jgi:hypothetical protein
MGNFLEKPGQVASTPDEPPPMLELGIDGLAIGTAEGCNDCRLEVVPGISASTAKLSRVFGDASPEECNSFDQAYKDVSDGKISFKDFKQLFKTGKLLRRRMVGDQGYCDLHSFKDREQESNITNLNVWNGTQWTDLPVIRIRKEGNLRGGYSRETKLDITTSIPFKLKFNGADVVVTTFNTMPSCLSTIPPIRMQQRSY